MLDDVVRYVLDEVSMDGSIGTSPTRFIALFTRTANPINLATDTTTPLPPHDTNTVVEEDEDGHPIIVVPPAIVEDLTVEEKREREGYARFVWRTVVDLEGVSVELLGDGTKALSKGKGRASEVVLHEEGGEGEVDEAAELGRIAEDDELAKGDDELRTVEEPMVGAGHEDDADDVDDGFAIDPALATLAPAPATTAPTSAAKNTSTEPAAVATTPATQTTPPGGIPESEKHDLMLLKEKYGDKVVLRASESMIMNALTGSYVRPARMSNIVYTALQYIARGKEFGMQVFDIAKKSGQKPSTVFYLVKTLTDMGLVAKIKDTESNKTNIAVHRRYLSENFQYQLRVGYLEYIARQSAETARAQGGGSAGGPAAGNGVEGEEHIPIDQTNGLPKFPPFGMESLGSRSFIKFRLVKLLRSDLWHHLIENKLLLKFLGFTPTYTLQTRRQFQRHVLAFKREGLIDEVMVPDDYKPDKPHRCLRLAEFRPKADEKETFEGKLPDVVSTVIDPTLLDTEDIEDEELLDEEDAERPFAPKELGYEHCYTIDHAVLQVVRHSGTQGITIRQIMRSLNNLDHKTVDVVVARYERLEHHPSHLNDFLFKVTQEVYRREKRLRVFTLENFRQRCIEDGIQLDDEIPKHPNIGRYADLSEYKFCKTPGGAKEVLDNETITVPRVSDKITQEHRKYVRRSKLAGRPIPRPGKAKFVGEDVDFQILGRPRKFIRTIGLDGKLVKRTKQTLVPVHPELPSVYLYNSETKVFFDVPDEWPGIGPVPKPPHWHTAMEPWNPIIPSTGQYARKVIKIDEKLQNRTAVPPKKGARGKKGAKAADDDEAPPPPPPKKTGRPKKSKASQPEPEAPTGNIDAEDQHVTIQSVLETQSETPAPKGKKRARKATEESASAAPKSVSRRRGKPPKSVAIVLDDASDTQETGANANGQVIDVDSPGLPDDAEASAVPKKKSRVSRKPPGTERDAEMELNIDPALLASAEADVLNSQSLIPAERSTGTNTATTARTPIQGRHLRDVDLCAMLIFSSLHVAAANDVFSAAPAFDTEVPSGQAASTSTQKETFPSTGLGSSPLKEYNAIPDTPAMLESVFVPGSRKRPRKNQSDPASQEEATYHDPAEPDPKRSRGPKKGRVLIQYPYKKREILEFVREMGGVTTGGNYLCNNLWEWVQKHKMGKSAFDGLLDKASMERLVASLENDGQLKQTFVALDVQWGGKDKIAIVRLPDTPQETVTAYINDVKINRQRATILPPMELEPGFTRTHSKLDYPLMRPVRLTEESLEALFMPIATLEALPSDQVREMFRKDWRLLAQHHGYVVGLFRRAKYLHIEIIRLLQNPTKLLPNGDRLLDVNVLRTQTSLRTLCRILPMTVQDGKLEKVLQNSQQADVPLKDCSKFLQTLIGVRRRSMRHKLGRLLLLLADLNVLETGYAVVDGNERVVSFTARKDETVTHVKILGLTPIYNYTANQDVATLPLKMINIDTPDAVEEYWYAVWFISLTKGDVNAAAIANFSDPSTVTATEPRILPPALKKKLAMRLHWQSEYALQKSQRRYLDYVYRAEGPDVASNVEKHAALSYRLFAPTEVVAEYLQHLASRVDDTVGVRLHPVSTRVPIQPVRDVIAEKARIRKEKLEAEWVQQIDRALLQIGQQTSDPLLTFLEPLHKQYLRNPSKYGPQQLMNAITSFFARLNSTGSVRRKRGRFITTTAGSLSTLQKTSRRHRTRWTSAMEELARDAFVILDARKEKLGLHNSGHNEALGQLFSTLDATKVRTRVLKWRRQHPANEAYLQRMQAAWKQVCEDHADEIPDPHPESFEDFDLKDHVEILRKYVKKELHVSSFFASVDEVDRMPELPEDVEQLKKAYEAQPRHRQIQVLDDAWLVYGDEKRDKALLSASTVVPILAEAPPVEEESAAKESGLIDSVVKMIVANPTENFDETRADTLLMPLHRPTVEAHVKDLLNRGVLTSYDKANAMKMPGRAYHFQESYHRALDTPISKVLQHDAEELLQTVPEDEFVPWPVISKEGEFAALLGLVSEDMVDMQIESDFALDILDTKGFRRARVIDDDCIELVVNLKLNEKGISAVEAPEHPHAHVWTSSISTDTTTEGIVSEKRAGKKREKVLSASALISAVENAGRDGITFFDLKKYFNSSDTAVITAIEKALANNKLVLTGYSQPILVHPRYKSDWQLSDAMPNPKQWLDVYGQKVESTFMKCIRAVYGLIVQKPGITQFALREALVNLFNRQELNDLLSHMMQRERIRRVAPPDVAISATYVDLLDARYEGLVSYFPDTLW
ncbi:hypothetical protein QFC21_005132 [Naganishia friedmannii]|uniref:Uncharacterized protein n=1 Tax=Naganishia friedmannii TaxID=89922 RepID=A0ACC2VCG2_9TREE|nr:hypothetical protein QFC21_005132 [Naganishia friedmannii]